MTELVSSSADSFSGILNADGFTTIIDPFAAVSGSAPPAYDDTSRIASFDQTYDLTPGRGEHSLSDEAGHRYGQQCGIGRHRRG
jgi:hypothetical protein